MYAIKLNNNYNSKQNTKIHVIMRLSWLQRSYIILTLHLCLIYNSFLVLIHQLNHDEMQSIWTCKRNSYNIPLLYVLLIGLSLKSIWFFSFTKNLKNNISHFFLQLACEFPDPIRPQQICSGLEFRRPECQLWLSCSLAGWPWVSLLAFLSSFSQLSYEAEYLSYLLHGAIWRSKWGNGYIRV